MPAHSSNFLGLGLGNTARGRGIKIGRAGIGASRGIGDRGSGIGWNGFFSWHFNVIGLRFFLGAFRAAASGKRQRGGGSYGKGGNCLHQVTSLFGRRPTA